ncbi:MAG: PQ-loop domain-containing transporter [Actinomycetota bacterium]
MLTVTQIAGFIGVALAGAAYVPQIWHLVRVHCSAGVSRPAFCLWLGASLLVTINAIATGATVFIFLGGVQIVATALILLYATRYRSSYCASHIPVQLEAGPERRVIRGLPRRESVERSGPPTLAPPVVTSGAGRAPSGARP